jgi:hypothetical protein
MNTEQEKLAGLASKLQGRWQGDLDTLRFFPEGSAMSGEMEWLHFSPASVHQMDYYVSLLEGQPHLKLQDNYGEKNFHIALGKEQLELTGQDGSRMVFRRIFNN